MHLVNVVKRTQQSGFKLNLKNEPSRHQFFIIEIQYFMFSIIGIVSYA
jgi:hypothetical protein